SPEYVPESDLEAHPEDDDDDDEDPEEDPGSLEDDEDDDMEIEADEEEEEEEHPTPADSLLAGRLNMLFRDRRAHAYTRHLMETKARLSREAWVRSTDASDLVRGEMTEIRELHAVDHRRQIVILELLRADYMRSTEIIELRTALQGQVTALQGQVIAL
nr:hypothetical protein [Tanacetum cinerariifolium]